MEARSNCVNDVRSSYYTDKHQRRCDDCQQSGDGIGHLAGLFLLTQGSQSGIYRNERCGKDALSKKVLQEVGNANCGTEDVCDIGTPEVASQKVLSSQSGNLAEKNACRDQRGRASGRS